MAALQLEYVKTSPHIGIILNLFEEHLDFFKSKEHYFLAKLNMFKYQDNSDYGLYTSSNEICLLPCSLCRYGLLLTLSMYRHRC